MQKVAIIYRVIQHYRAPFFELLSNDRNINLTVLHGPDFKNTKVVSKKNDRNFNSKKIFSIKLKYKTINGDGYMPISPFLLFELFKLKPDVIISEGASNLFNALQGFIYCRITNKKFVWWSLGEIQNRKKSMLRKIFDRLIHFIEKNSHSIITYSSIGMKYFLSLGIKKDKIYKALNVVDTDSVISKLNLKIKRKSPIYKSNYKFKIIFVGALIKEKNIDNLIRAFAIMKNIDENIELIIVGDGPYKSELIKLKKHLNVKNINFVGSQFDNIDFYWRSADLFVLPGLGGLAISEAMCYSLPILCSIGDGCEVDLVNKKNGIIEKDMTPENIAKHIEHLIKQDLKSMGSESLRIILERYNTKNYVRKIIESIE